VLTGCRLGELEALRWDEVDLDARPSGELRLGVGTKTHRGRVVDLAVCPVAKDILGALPRTGAYVFGSVDEHGKSAPLSRDVNKRWRKALANTAAGAWTWQQLRQTTGTWLTCAPGIFGGSSAYRSARQLGHRVQVAEEHYLGLLRGISPAATTIEAAMEAEKAFGLVVGRLAGKV
jgi:integrase